jgi:large subunit ribosomal protein L25
MAKQIKLAAQARPIVGRSAVRKLKQQGFVPAVVYGAKQAPEHLKLSAREIGNVLAHATGEHFLVELEITGEGATTNRLALVQEIQHHPIRGDVLHVDFHAVSADEKLHAAVPIETFGEPAGVKNFGGLLEVSLHSLDVECFPRDLPEVIRVDVSALGIGEALHVRDLPLPEGVAAHVDGELTVIRVSAPTVQEEVSTAPTATVQPEVIKEKKPDEKETK